MKAKWSAGSVGQVCKRGGHFGIRLEETPGEDVGLLSYRQALIAYASTYSAVGRSNCLKTVDTQDTTDPDDVTRYRREYIGVYMQAIIYAHHFAELTLKRLLRSRSELLVLAAGNDICLLDDLERGLPPDSEKLRDVKTVEFAEALRRLKALVGMSKISDSVASNLVNQHYQTLSELNNLRNRIWHRGTYALHYDALDCLFGKYLLPVMREMVKVYPSAQRFVWMHKELHCGIKPFEIIEACFASKKMPEPEEVAYFKEMARAAYCNPLGSNKSLRHANRDALAQAETICWLHDEMEHLDKVVCCPVCGEKTLMRFEESVDVYSDDDPDMPESSEWIISKVKCSLCGFELDRGSMCGTKNSDILLLFDNES